MTEQRGPLSAVLCAAHGHFGGDEDRPRAYPDAAVGPGGACSPSAFRAVAQEAHGARGAEEGDAG
ncbi:hypothetical protein [Streptomyces specialis]|uniref:hypothetical protein n=1 Tax=Streptomyces specialis TaxID=498367 RepID=UPI00073F4786|nr:hypothetical protein [Streptomyces specialis]